jgi:hypothetical protein
MHRSIYVANGNVNAVPRFFPVKTPDTGIGAGRDAHSAADALVVVLVDDTRCGIFIGRSYWADPCAGWVLAMLARQGKELHLQVWVNSRWAIWHLASNGVDPVPPDGVWDVVRTLAGYDASVAANATPCIKYHT